jgi:hypothetical protein
VIQSVVGSAFSWSALNAGACWIWVCCPLCVFWAPATPTVTVRVAEAELPRPTK